MPARLLPAIAVLLALAAGTGCRSRPPPPSLLDVEMEQYRGDREEHRLEDLRARTARAKAEADRLDAELAAHEAALREKRERVAAAAAKALELPPPLRIVEQPVPPPPAK